MGATPVKARFRRVEIKTPGELKYRPVRAGLSQAENYFKGAIMGKEEDIKTGISRIIIEGARERHAEAIDKAYEYFWDSNQPDEFLSGTALALGFLNFEEWFVYDYKANELGETFLDLYAKDNQCLSAEESSVISKMKDSVLSLYEVASISKDKRVLLKDLLLEEEVSLREKSLTRGLKKGDIFAARILQLDGKEVMSGSVYPYLQPQKKRVLGYVEKQYARYRRHVRPEGTMREYLKQYGDIFNLVWMQLIADQAGKEAQ
jgi:hypothetical protein